MTCGDYAFRIPNDPEKIDAMVALGWEEFSYRHRQNIPFIMVSHWHGLAWDDDAGYAVHRKLIPRILESGLAEPMAFSSLLARWERESFSDTVAHEDVTF